MLEYPSSWGFAGENALRPSVSQGHAVGGSQELSEPSDLPKQLGPERPASAVHDGWTAGARPGPLSLGDVGRARERILAHWPAREGVAGSAYQRHRPLHAVRSARTVHTRAAHHGGP